MFGPIAAVSRLIAVACLLLAATGSSAHADKRVALVIGNSTYGHARALANPASDAKLMSDTLLYCDMTTGPDGDYVRPADRLVEIRGRHGPDHEVTRFVELAAPEILATAARVDEMLAVQPR